jgi:hypothetical protein
MTTVTSLEMGVGYPEAAIEPGFYHRVILLAQIVDPMPFVRPSGSHIYFNVSCTTARYGLSVNAEGLSQEVPLVGDVEGGKFELILDDVDFRYPIVGVSLQLISDLSEDLSYISWQGYGWFIKD